MFQEIVDVVVLEVYLPVFQMIEVDPSTVTVCFQVKHAVFGILIELHRHCSEDNPVYFYDDFCKEGIVQLGLDSIVCIHSVEICPL